MKYKFLILLLIISIVSILNSVSALTSITGCSELSINGETYQLDANINASIASRCLRIINNNINLISPSNYNISMDSLGIAFQINNTFKNISVSGINFYNSSIRMIGNNDNITFENITFVRGTFNHIGSTSNLSNITLKNIISTTSITSTDFFPLLNINTLTILNSNITAARFLASAVSPANIYFNNLTISITSAATTGVPDYYTNLTNIQNLKIYNSNFLNSKIILGMSGTPLSFADLVNISFINSTTGIIMNANVDTFDITPPATQSGPIYYTGFRLNGNVTARNIKISNNTGTRCIQITGSNIDIQNFTILNASKIPSFDTTYTCISISPIATSLIISNVSLKNGDIGVNVSYSGYIFGIDNSTVGSLITDVYVEDVNFRGRAVTADLYIKNPNLVTFVNVSYNSSFTSISLGVGQNFSQFWKYSAYTSLSNGTALSGVLINVSGDSYKNSTYTNANGFMNFSFIIPEFNRSGSSITYTQIYNTNATTLISGLYFNSINYSYNITSTHNIADTFTFIQITSPLIFASYTINSTYFLEGNIMLLNDSSPFAVVELTLNDTSLFDLTAPSHLLNIIYLTPASIFNFTSETFDDVILTEGLHWYNISAINDYGYSTYGIFYVNIVNPTEEIIILPVGPGNDIIVTPNNNSADYCITNPQAPQCQIFPPLPPELFPTPVDQNESSGIPEKVSDGNLSWIVQTDGKGNKYTLYIAAGKFRNRLLVYQNLGNKTVNITLTCDGDLCPFIKYQYNKFSLKVIKDKYFLNTFTVTLPSFSLKSSYVAHLISTDQSGNKAIITVEVKVSSLGYLVDFFSKLWGLKDINGIKVPYLLFLLLIMIPVFIFSNHFQKNEYRSLISFFIAMFSGFIVLLII